MTGVSKAHLGQAHACGRQRRREGRAQVHGRRQRCFNASNLTEQVSLGTVAKRVTCFKTLTMKLFIKKNSTEDRFAGTHPAEGHTLVGNGEP
jgi:hypothetical protein